MKYAQVIWQLSRGLFSLVHLATLLDKLQREINDIPIMDITLLRWQSFIIGAAFIEYFISTKNVKKYFCLWSLTLIKYGPEKYISLSSIMHFLQRFEQNWFSRCVISVKIVSKKKKKNPWVLTQILYDYKYIRILNCFQQRASIQSLRKINSLNA